MGLILVVVVVASGSKNCQKVEESSKSPKNVKGLKSCKGHRFGGTFTESPALCQRRTRASVRTLTVFRALFARPRSYLNTTLASIIDKAKQLIELLMRCPHQVPICAAHMFPLLLQLWDALRLLRHQNNSRTHYARHAYALRKKTSQSRISLMAGGCRGSCASPRPALRS